MNEGASLSCKCSVGFGGATCEERKGRLNIKLKIDIPRTKALSYRYIPMTGVCTKPCVFLIENFLQNVK